MMTEPTFSVTDAVAVINQTLSAVYPRIIIVGELESFRVAKQRWVYADLKDETSKLRLFGTIYQLPGPLEDGMMVEVSAEPRLHPQFGFSLNIQTIRPIGEGSLKKASDKLEAKLAKEGLFNEDRKRAVPHPPEKIAFITADGSAAQADFMKIAAARWPLASIQHIQTSVQGSQAPEELVRALAKAGESDADVTVVVRGGGSADDLAAFNDERVVRAIAASRQPTVVAIGHEVDTSLSERAADMSASTPSNAAELLLPDSSEVLTNLNHMKTMLHSEMKNTLESSVESITADRIRIKELALRWSELRLSDLQHVRTRLDSYHPKHTLARGYALLSKNGKMLKANDSLAEGDDLEIQRSRQTALVKVKGVSKND